MIKIGNFINVRNPRYEKASNNHIQVCSDYVGIGGCQATSWFGGSLSKAVVSCSVHLCGTLGKCRLTKDL